MPQLSDLKISYLVFKGSSNIDWTVFGLTPTYISKISHKLSTNVIQIDIVVLLVVNILVDVLARTMATVMSKVTDVVTDMVVIDHVFHIYIQNDFYNQY